MSSMPASVNIAAYPPAEGKAAPPRRQRPSAPSAREFYSGLAVLTALAAVAMMRGGTPRSLMAGEHAGYARHTQHASMNAKPEQPTGTRDQIQCLQYTHASADR